MADIRYLWFLINRVLLISDNGLEASPGSTLDEDSSCCFGSKRNQHRRRKTKSKICCCCNESNPPQEFEDEIYSEICSNNHSVRQVMGDTNPYAGANTGTMMALGTLSNAQPNMLGMFSIKMSENDNFWSHTPIPDPVYNLS